MLYLVASFLLLLVVPLRAADNSTDDDNGSLLAQFNQTITNFPVTFNRTARKESSNAEAESLEKNTIDGVARKELSKAVQGINATVTKTSAQLVEALEKNSVDDVRNQLNRAVQGLNGTVTENSAKVTNVIADLTGVKNLDACTAVDCNNRGTCIGTKRAYICACILGYSGKNCEEAMCDSMRDCNGRGLCFGTTTSLTCLCNIGYTGRRCERQV